MNKQMGSNKPSFTKVNDTKVNDVSNVVSDDVTTTKEGGLADKAGDVLEKIGHKISEVGMPAVGQKIHDMGDKMERTHTDVNHPHDV